MHLLFDIDGTVVDHRGRTYWLYQEYGRQSNLRVLDESEYFERKRRGEDEAGIARRTFPEEVIAGYIAWKRTHIESADALERDVLVDGMRSALEALAALHPLVALSGRQSNDVLIEQLRRLEVWGFFRASLAVPEHTAAVGKAGAISSYLHQEELTGGDALVIGDTEVEIEAAGRTGVACVSVAWGLRSRAFLLAHGAERVVESVAELRRVLRAD